MYVKYFYGFLRFLGKIPKAIVSGIPTQKIYSKPDKVSKVYSGDDEVMHDFDKHHHKPESKPVVEKQTLLKETKKLQGHHK